MFSKGQLIFLVFFVIVFTAGLVWSYRKDTKLHKIYYKKVWMVAVGILIVVAIFATLTFILHT
ncbi:MAG TPA: hypothetical protein ENK46_04945 [Flavobacteriia bacterium]|jgi:phage-related holin|nr:hypothetical protein [Flavobacteriia bacterium]